LLQCFARQINFFLLPDQSRPQFFVTSVAQGRQSHTGIHRNDNYGGLPGADDYDASQAWAIGAYAICAARHAKTVQAWSN